MSDSSNTPNLWSLELERREALERFQESKRLASGLYEAHRIASQHSFFMRDVLKEIEEKMRAIEISKGLSPTCNYLTIDTEDDGGPQDEDEEAAS